MKVSVPKPAINERRRGAKSLAGLIAQPEFRPKLDTANSKFSLQNILTAIKLIEEFILD